MLSRQVCAWTPLASTTSFPSQKRKKYSLVLYMSILWIKFMIRMCSNRLGDACGIWIAVIQVEKWKIQNC